jgi:hypothetical protein
MGIMAFMKVHEPAHHHAMQPVGGGKPGKNSLVAPFLILLAAMMLGGIAYRGATVILPAYFELKNTGIQAFLAQFFGSGVSGNLVATTTASLIYLIGMFGQYTGGRAGERFDLRYAYLVFHAVAIPAVLLMSVAANIPLVMLTVVYMFFLLGMQPLENTLVARFTPPKFRHSAYGAKFVLTFGTGSIAVKILGSIEKAWGIESTFFVLGGVSALLVGTIGLLILRTRFMNARGETKSAATAPQEA